MKKRTFRSLITAFILAGAVLFTVNAWAKPQETCPIMGGPINKSVYTDYNGKRVYFCCKGCPETFLKEPEKYISQMEKDGVELEKAPAQPAVQ